MRSLFLVLFRFEQKEVSCIEVLKGFFEKTVGLHNN